MRYCHFARKINFFYPLLRKVCVSIDKTSIRVVAHSWLNCQISRRYTRCQVDITAQPSESGLITVYLYIPETGPQNGVGWLLQKVICPPTCCVTWMYCPYTWVISSKIWWPFEHSTERYRDLTISESPIHKASSPEVSTVSPSFFETTGLLCSEPILY